MLATMQGIFSICSHAVNLVCEAREGSDGQSVVVSCVSDRELTQILCSVNSAPFNSCKNSI